MRALTGLGQAGKAVQAVQQQVKGKLDEMPLNKIMRDPSNLRPPLHQRTSEEQQAQRELNASIKKRGVKSPISLRPHPTAPDIWIINHGHCRYDGAEAAGLAAIPYFIDPNFDSYDQMAENLHRADLSPWAIAEFIKRKLEEKQTKGQIAEGLGKENESYITEHLALVDAPECLHQAYMSGVRSTRTLYDLRRAYEEFPEQVESWCATQAKVTRTSIQELLQELRCNRNKAEIIADAPAPPAPSEFRHDEKTLLDSSKQIPPSTDVEQEREGSDNPAQLMALTEQRPIEATSADLPSSQTTSEFRHDEKKRSASLQCQALAERSKKQSANGEIQVRYKGEPARISANTTVEILVDGQNVPLKVQLSELVFNATK